MTDKGLIIDAEENVTWARDLIEALQPCGDRAVVAVVHHALERLENAQEILQSIRERGEK